MCQWEFMKERWESSEWNPPVFVWSSGVWVSVILYSWVRNRESLFQVVCWMLVSLISAAACYFAYRAALSNEATTSFPVVTSHKEGTTHLCFTSLSFHTNPWWTHTHTYIATIQCLLTAIWLAESYLVRSGCFFKQTHTYVYASPKGIHLKNSIRWLNICCSKTQKKKKKQ